MSVAVEMARDSVAQRLWARDRLMASVRGLDASRLSEDMAMGQGTLLLTLEHMLQAEEVWISVLEGDGAVKVTPGTLTSLEAIEAAWPGVDARWAQSMYELTEGRLGETVSRTSSLMQRTYALKVRDVLLHVSTHAMYTLAQAANMVRRLGGEAPSTGYAAWVVEGKG